jgi:glycosyl transferase family 25
LKKYIKISIVVISLPSAKERRSKISECLSEFIDFEWTFFDALRADDDVRLPSSTDRQIGHYGRPLVSNEIGCFKSHYSVLQKYSQDTHSDWLLVLEDDIWIDVNFDLLALTAFCTDQKIDYCRLFSKAFKPGKTIGSLPEFRQIIRYWTDPYGTQAYLINKSGALKFIDSIKEIVLPIDDELGRFWRHGLEPIAIFPYPVVERSLVSTIEVSRSNGNENRTSWRPDLVIFRIREKILKALWNLKYRIKSILS